ncbi:hypothetical protein BD408DRAFT_462051 [Parasitella parasitica]|nr:hypothetical protein BD408DRAFT_462051 [Parasitella parasitica]
MIYTENPVIVVGAGVIGLSVALQLKLKGYKKVTIVAKYIPGDLCIEYTSPYAGAHWRSMAPGSNKLLQKFDAVTYDRFMNLAHSSDNPGIMILPSYDYYDDASSPDITDPWFKDVVRDVGFIHKMLRLKFEFLTEKDGLPHGAQLGHKYTTVFGLQEDPNVINCTGLGARYIGGVNDEAVFPTRGQTIVVKATHIKKTITHLGTQGINYVIPRSDGTVILGGTANKHDFNPFPEAQASKTILEKTLALCPELKDQPLDIVKYNVGLRPSRIGGVRIENELLSKNKKQTIQVTHGYGHGGFGVQSSWGCAEYIVQVMQDGLTESKAARL